MAEQGKNRLLIFDTILDGHHSDYMTHLVDFWIENQLSWELYVVTPAGFKDTLSLDAQAACGITFVEMTADELYKAQHTSRLSRAFLEWRLFVDYCEQIQPVHALLMYFDLFQIGAWLGKSPPCPVSGIYFRPSFHYDKAHSWKEKVKELRKKWLLGRVLARGVVANLFCLDKSSIPAIKKMAKRATVLPLVDPVVEYDVSEQEATALKKALEIPDERTVFLIFGYLDDRKGILPTLDAINHLTPEECSQLTLVLAGQMNEAYRQLIEEYIASHASNAQIVCQFHEILRGEIQVYFHLTDYVLTLYQRHIGMSSVIARAALSDKPLISSDYGYMGYLVRSEKLGEVVDSQSIPAITEILRRALRGEVKASLADTRRFSEQNSYLNFSRQIVSALMEAPAPTR